MSKRRVIPGLPYLRKIAFKDYGISSLSTDNRFYEENHYYDFRKVNGPVFESDFMFSEYVAGLGATLDHFSLELRYARSTGPTRGDLAGRIRAISLLLHYRF